MWFFWLLASVPVLAIVFAASFAVANPPDGDPW